MCVVSLRTDYKPTADPGGIWIFDGYNASSSTGP